MSKNTPWIFVDCEARGTSPVHGVLTEFGAVHYDTRDTFYGRLFEATPDPDNPAISIVGERLATDKEVAERFAAWLQEHLGNRQPVFVSDNPAYDWQWIAGMFDRAGMDNPFGHSGRRIGDFWAGLNQNWSDTQSWKRFRRTAHDHNPVNDAMGNVEAFEEILRVAQRSQPRASP
jgi:3' exoribonuclease, RNase T-like